ncbi:MAG TPA: 50S ribosomal protein L13 [Candidatus Saccharimonadales bacterium]|nr:50S ribosomal protein L13 [Candidatus Saccharimonadales bacterium]
MTKTYSAKPTDIQRDWYILDAGELTLGRLATRIAQLLMGKGKPMFTKHIDCGDFVIVINSDKLKVTGNKLADKKYYRHSGYPGNLRELSLQERIDKDSTKVIADAVRGMLPDNKLRDGRLSRLKVYKDENHKHSAQNPQQFDLKKGKQ